MGAYDGVPGDPGDENRTQIVLKGQDGVFYAVEAGFKGEETELSLALEDGTEQLIS